MVTDLSRARAAELVDEGVGQPRRHRGDHPLHPGPRPARSWPWSGPASRARPDRRPTPTSRGRARRGDRARRRRRDRRGQAGRAGRPPRLGRRPTGRSSTGCWPASPSWPASGDPERPGIVHRLDRGTSGLMVVARTPAAYDALVAQLADHRVTAAYRGAGARARRSGRRARRRADRPVDATIRPGGPCATTAGRRGPATRRRPASPNPCRPRSCAAGWRPAAPTRSASTSRPSATPSSATTATAVGCRPACRSTGRSSTPAELGFDHPDGRGRLTFEARCRRPRHGGSPLQLSARRSSLTDRLAGPAAQAGTSGQGCSPRAMAAMSASVIEPSSRRMCSPDVGPDGQQHALALVVAGAVGVGLAEVAGGDRAVDGADDLRQRDPAGGRART